ncbi:MAG: leucyl-tRNA synthetase, partial [Flavobacteriales bacterium]
GWAGSSFYWMRYMDAHNEKEFASKEALAYWENVDLYIGGNEHATGHLLYSRFWNKFLKDKGFAPTEEPFKKLINQGMILGTSAFVYRFMWSYFGEAEIIETSLLPTILLSKNLVDKIRNNDEISIANFKSKINLIIENKFSKTNFQIPNLDFNAIHTDVSIVTTSDELDVEKFRNWREDYKDAIFIGENGEIIENNKGKYIVGREVEKMSKSKYNVVTPDAICAEYGADTLRLYEMFLGPLEQAKPWNTAGISGVFSFLKKLWRLYYEEDTMVVTNDAPIKDNLKTLHKTIKKVAGDIENFSFNTSVSQFMICVNELSTQKCHSRAILEPLAIVISPYAPHIAEELWSVLGHEGSIALVPFPVCEAKHLVESEKEYPVSFNGKMRFTITLPLDLAKEQIEEIVMKDERTIKQLEGRTPNKVIIVPGKIINLVG